MNKAQEGLTIKRYLVAKRAARKMIRYMRQKKQIQLKRRYSGQFIMGQLTNIEEMKQAKIDHPSLDQITESEESEEEKIDDESFRSNRNLLSAKERDSNQISYSRGSSFINMIDYGGFQKQPQLEIENHLSVQKNKILKNRNSSPRVRENMPEDDIISNFNILNVQEKSYLRKLSV